MLITLMMGLFLLAGSSGLMARMMMVLKSAFRPPYCLPSDWSALALKPDISSDNALDQVHDSASRHQRCLPALRVEVETVKLSGGLLQLGDGHLGGGLQQLCSAPAACADYFKNVVIDRLWFLTPSDA